MAAEGVPVREPRPRREGRHGLGRSRCRTTPGEAPPSGRTPSCWPAIAATGTGDGIHLLGPLSKKVVRVAPPLVITQDEAAAAVSILKRAARESRIRTAE